jgi:hypothetical protein
LSYELLKKEEGLNSSTALHAGTPQ